MEILGYRPDSFSDGNYAVIKVMKDGTTEIIEKHYDKEHIERRATSLNMDLITKRLFSVGHISMPEPKLRKLNNIIEKAAALVAALMSDLPKCADQSAAVRNAREAVNWSITALASDGYA